MKKHEITLNNETRTFAVLSATLTQAERDMLNTWAGYCSTAEEKALFAQFVGGISQSLKEKAVADVIEQADHLTALLKVPTYARISYNADKGTMAYKSIGGHVDLSMLLSGIKSTNRTRKGETGFKPVEFRHGLNAQQTALVCIFSHLACGGFNEVERAELLRICNKAGKGAERDALKGFYKVATSDEVSNKAQAGVMSYFYALFNARTGNSYKAVGSYKVGESETSVTAFALAEKSIRTFNGKKWEFRNNEGNFTSALSALIVQYINTGVVLADKGKSQTAESTLSETANAYNAPKPAPAPAPKADSKPKAKSKSKAKTPAKAESVPAPAPETAPATEESKAK